MYILVLIISFATSLVGAICGIGGGVLLKPTLDAMGIMSVSAISFLSGCTVLSMSAISVCDTFRGGGTQIKLRTVVPLALGAAFGGLTGKVVFQYIKSLAASEDTVGMIQAIVLLAVTALTLIYTVKKDKVKTMNLENGAVSFIIGVALGFMSSFLGIGGGPINLMVLSFFFSMGTKEAATNSLFVILVSQIASLMLSLCTGSVPDIQISYLVLMVAGGLLGGKLGHKLCRRLSEKQVNTLFELLMIVIIGINIYNIYKFS